MTVEKNALRRYKLEAQMAGPWLYTIAKRAGLEFELGEHRKVPVSIESYKQLLRNGKLAKDKWWYISQKWKDIKDSDEVFIYTGDEDLGIIGYATVQKVKQKGDYWHIRMNFDIKKSLFLLENPISATIVREWVQYPRRNVVDLARYKTQLYRLLPWGLPQERSRVMPSKKS